MPPVTPRVAYCLSVQRQTVLVLQSAHSPVSIASDGMAVCVQPIHTGGLRLVTSGREVQPALGLAWANCVNHRVFLSREAQPFVVADPAEPSQLQTQVRTFMLERAGLERGSPQGHG